MRRLFLLLLLALSAAAALAWLVRLDAGYVMLRFHGTTVETTVWFAAAALVVILVLFYYAARLLLLAVSMVTRLAGARRAPLPRRIGRSRGERGAQAWIEGRWSAAARLLAGNAPRSEAPLLNYVLAARAAAASGDAPLARGFLAMADELPGARAAVSIERARLQAGAGEYAAALATLDAQGAAAQPAAIDLLLDLLPHCAAWERMLDATAEARRLGLRNGAALDTMELTACTALLRAAGRDSASLRRAWDALPASARGQPALVAQHALALSAAGQGSQALELLETKLSKTWDPSLVRALGQVRGEDVIKQLARAERLLAKHPADAELLLALGRISLAGRMWAKARDYLESSLGRVPHAETCAELARACEQLGDTDRARALRERSIALALGTA